MTDLTVAEVLERAADLIEPEGAWTQGADARDAHGNDIDGFEPGEEPIAVCFCAGEAIHRVSGLWFNCDPAHQALRAIVGDVPEWNDAPEPTQAEVVAKLREAAKLARDRDASLAEDADTRLSGEAVAARASEGGIAR